MPTIQNSSSAVQRTNAAPSKPLTTGQSAAPATSLPGEQGGKPNTKSGGPSDDGAKMNQDLRRLRIRLQKQQDIQSPGGSSPKQPDKLEGKVQGTDLARMRGGAGDSSNDDDFWRSLGAALSPEQRDALVDSMRAELERGGAASAQGPRHRSTGYAGSSRQQPEARAASQTQRQNPNMPRQAMVMVSPHGVPMPAGMRPPLPSTALPVPGMPFMSQAAPMGRFGVSSQGPVRARRSTLPPMPPANMMPTSSPQGPVRPQQAPHPMAAISTAASSSRSQARTQQPAPRQNQAERRRVPDPLGEEEKATYVGKKWNGLKRAQKDKLVDFLSNWGVLIKQDAKIPEMLQDYCGSLLNDANGVKAIRRRYPSTQFSANMVAPLDFNKPLEDTEKSRYYNLMFSQLDRDQQVQVRAFLAQNHIKDMSAASAAKALRGFFGCTKIDNKGVANLRK